MCKTKYNFTDDELYQPNDEKDTKMWASKRDGGRTRVHTHTHNGEWHKEDRQKDTSGY